jgi:cytochrome bd-type quinol oxidase subunit 1
LNYPAWVIDGVDGGLIIAIVSIIHVYIAHFAVGGGIFLVVTETIARRRKDEALLASVKGFTKFFLLLTMVAGGMTGVGIWFTIALVQPAGTSALIHQFVFGWATEWVFFIVEISALLFYHYMWDKLEARVHLAIGWIYAAAAWLSLAVIDGILSFMLTPGKWLASGSFWDGLFNPGYLPSLVFRSAVALMIAGLFGLIAALRAGDPKLRRFLARYASAWIVLPMLLMLVSGWWYFRVSDAELKGELFKGFWFIGGYRSALLGLSIALFAGGLALLIRLPGALSPAVAGVLIAVGLGWMGSFEFLREMARKPWVVRGYMYSSSVLAADLPRIEREGWLKEARWVRKLSKPAATALDFSMAGADMLASQCLPCHTVGGRRDLAKLTAGLDVQSMEEQLEGQGASGYMPPFAGNAEDREALANYIVRAVQKKDGADAGSGATEATPAEESREGEGPGAKAD